MTDNDMTMTLLCELLRWNAFSSHDDDQEGQSISIVRKKNVMDNGKKELNW